MLTPEYLETVGEEIGALYEAVVTDILADIAERITLAENSMTATTEYLNQKLRDIGLQQKYINTKLAELMNTTESMVEDIMEESTYKSTRDSFELYRAAGYDATGVDFSNQILKGTNVLKGELKNLTRTTAKLANSTLIKSYDKAYLQVSSGAYSFDQACKNVIKDLTSQGIGTIVYDSGAKRTVESAVRLAVRTSVNQNALACEIDLINEIDDANLVETSSHLGARPSHSVWQGKVFWTKHEVKGYDNFYDATGYGTGEGLGGYNCKHSFHPYFEEFGQTYFPVDEEANAELYEQMQKQRYHERKMREWDRTIQIQKAAGQDTKTADQWKNYHKQKINELIKDGKGLLKRNYSAEKGYSNTNSRFIGGSNDWSETKPRTVTKEEIDSLKAYAKSNGITIKYLDEFDGEPENVKMSIDSLVKIMDKYPLKSKTIELSSKIFVNDNDFAETQSKHHIYLNTKAMRDIAITEKNMNNDPKFLAGTKIEHIAMHEYGHVIASQIGEKGIEILKKALYNLDKEIPKTVDDIREFLIENVSGYAGRYYYSDSENARIALNIKVKCNNINKLKEVIPEMITKNEIEPTELTIEFCRILREEYLL